jgi:EAL domain-containing protein (putative c-di-GMP-specific phosphodiesterase class I)
VPSDAKRLLSARPTAREILAARAVVTHFQPIYSAKQKSVIGVEALSRGRNPATAEIVPPAELFALARAEQLHVELEDLCRDTALRTFAALREDGLILFLNMDAKASGIAPGRNGLLFLNFDASAERQIEPAAEALMRRVRRFGIDPRGVAIEILESQFEDLDRLKWLARSLHQCGFLLVLDDVGAGHSNLDRIPIIRPDVLKIDGSLIRQIDRDYHRQETVKSLTHLARRIGAIVVAEGVETEAEALAAMELGVDMLQGFYLARPQPADAITQLLDGAAIDALAARYKQHMVAKINQRKLQHRRYAVVINTILCELGKADVAEFDAILARLITEHPMVECLYVLDESGRQMTESICSFDPAATGHRVMFQPASRGADHSLKEFYYVLLDVELQKYTTEPYVSLASGHLCQTISTCFRDSNNNKLYILCVDVTAD